ncbi:unnamed protein product [Clavelina lepadiformis]|uniref:Uncharacterized protein n=1 Tax=Clavelina lepadiformis TaxID=159417 RepID=A0ABP0FS03_CLALP
MCGHVGLSNYHCDAITAQLPLCKGSAKPKTTGGSKIRFKVEEAGSSHQARCEGTIGSTLASGNSAAPESIAVGYFGVDQEYSSVRSFKARRREVTVELTMEEILVVLLLLAAKLDAGFGQECGSVLKGSGVIKSQGYPETYPSNFDCTWTIEAEEYDRVQVVFEDFNVEPGESCEFDFLEMRAMGESKRFCGDKLSDVGNNGQLSVRGRLVLRLGSDDSVQLRGISLRYEVIPGEPPTTPPSTTPPVTIATTVPPIVSCEEEPCLNEGECLQVDENEIYCMCKDGFEGDYCQNNVDDCGSNPCENGATCIDGVNKWSCQCVEGYIGETCAIDYDECRAEPCKNGGTCEDKLNAFVCICTEGWTGWDCDTEIDECDPNPCENYGVCDDHLGFYTCVCHPKYTGRNCTIPVAEPTEEPTASEPDQPDENDPQPDENDPQPEEENSEPEDKQEAPGLSSEEPDTTSPFQPDVELTTPAQTSTIEAPDEDGSPANGTEPEYELQDPTTPTHNDTRLTANQTETPTDQIETSHENFIPTAVIATLAAVTSLTGIISSLLYYLKTTTKSRQIHDVGQLVQGT